MPLSVKLRAGRFAVRRSLNPAAAAYTRQMRSQMKAIEQSLRDVLTAVKQQSPEILEAALRPTFDLSQEYVPKKTGRLMRSGFLEVTQNPVTPTLGRVTATIGYGKSGDPPYTVFVHEMLETFHAPPTRAKFLQAAVEEDIGNIESRLAEGYSIPNG